jgi:Na+-transporting NADH:ubiquinone oxidoreductase subunit NqrF
MYMLQTTRGGLAGAAKDQQTGSMPLSMPMRSCMHALPGMREMTLDLLDTDGDTRPITLVYGARHRAELYYHERFEALAARCPNFRYVPALSAPTPACGWSGPAGYVHDVAAAHFGNDFRGSAPTCAARPR